MSKTMQHKAALIVLLTLAAIGGGALPDRAAVAMWVFGVVNVLVAAPGTKWVRMVTVLAVTAALAWPATLFEAVTLLAWLVWPPAYAVAWATARAPQRPEPAEAAARATGARIAVAAMIAAVAIASLLYRGLLSTGLEQTAALFVGVPAVLAIVVVFGISPRSAAGVACKAVTVGLLVSLLFLWEGVVCVVMSAPLFYAVALGVAYLFQEARGGYARRQSWLSCVAALALIPMGLEGVSDRTSLNRNEEVTHTKIIRASAHDVERAIFETPRFDRVLPLYLRAGFPRPIATAIRSDGAATRWLIRMRGGEMKVNGMEPRAGDLVLELLESRPGLVRWRAVADDSHMTHFLRWRESTVRWEPVGPEATRVTWTLRYRRGLDPAWYFGPWQRYAAQLAADYLIDAVATP